jgi:oligoendopeptidase F
MRDNLSNLPRPSHAYPRKYLDAHFAPNSWDSIEPVLTELLQRPLHTQQDAIKWILDSSELEAVIQEEGARLYINMTCFTDDEDNAKAFSSFIENIEPKLAAKAQHIRQKLIDYLEHAVTNDDAVQSSHTGLDTVTAVSPLPPMYTNYIQSARNSHELFCEKNILLHTKESLQVQEYQKVTGAQSVVFEGEERTLSQMNSFLESPDRSLRESAWRSIAQRRLQDKHKLNTHFETLFALRNQIAQNAGFPNFVPYIFKQKQRWDYSPQDCETFHNTIEEHVVPLARALNERRRKNMNIPSLRPWDISCDPFGRPALKPFASSDDLTSKCSLIFHELDEELAAQFDQMRQLNLLDLNSRLGKAPGGYQCSLDEYRLPYIFMNAAGTNSDLFTLLHESGHSFHQFAMAHHDITQYRDIPSEFAEVASMSMELMGMDYLHFVYVNPEDRQRAKQEQIEDIFSLLCWVATVDAFQIWMYSNPNHTPAQRSQKWLELTTRFNTGVDWSGLEQELEHSWHRQLHIFEVPFYYIEYGIAQLGALQLWDQYRQNRKQALTHYKQALALGSSKPLKELFSTAGIHFDFSPQIVKPFMENLAKEVQLV